MQETIFEYRHLKESVFTEANNAISGECQPFEQSASRIIELKKHATKAFR